MEGQYFEYTMGSIPETTNVNGEPAPASASPKTNPNLPSSFDVCAMPDEEFGSLFESFLNNGEPIDLFESNKLFENNESVESSEHVESNENLGSNENTDFHDDTDSDGLDQLDALFEEIEETNSHSSNHFDQAEPNDGAAHAPDIDESSKEPENAPQHIEAGVDAIAQVEPNEHISSSEKIASNTKLASNELVEPNKPVMPTDEEAFDFIKGLGDDDWFPSFQFNGYADDCPPDGSSAEQNHAAADYAQHQPVNINTSVQPEATQAVRPLGVHTEAAAHETLYQSNTPHNKSTAHADNNFTDVQLYNTQTTSAEPNLAQEPHVNPASFNQYHNTAHSIYTQLETTQAIYPSGGYTGTVNHSSINHTADTDRNISTINANSALLNEQLCGNQAISAEESLPQEAHLSPTFPNQYCKTPTSVYASPEPNMVASFPQQQSVTANCHSTQHQNNAMANHSACGPSMAAQYSQQQDIAASSYVQYHPTAPNYQSAYHIGSTYNNSAPMNSGHGNSNTASSDSPAVNSHSTHKRKSPDAESETPSQFSTRPTTTPTPQSSRPTKRAKPSPCLQIAQPTSAPPPPPNPTKRKRTNTPSTAPWPATKRAKNASTSTPSPPPHPSKPTLLAHLAHAPWATPAWQHAHLRATCRAALAAYPQPGHTDANPAVADALAFWTALARCGRGWAGANWQRTQLTAAGRAAVAGAGRELEAVEEAAERWAAVHGGMEAGAEVEGEGEGEEEAKARRGKWVGGRPRWVYGQEVWNREDWQRAEYSLAAGSMLSGGGKGEAVADQYVGMKRGKGGKGRKVVAAAGKKKQGKPSLQTAARQQVQEQAEEQVTAKISIVEGLPDYPDHY